jgi:predicted mannosyl-3-phosphoglycerate phosphatase (HAD superfamily)
MKVNRLPGFFQAIALDFDGTLTEGGPPTPATLESLGTARRLGYRLLLVTGRFLADLRRIFPEAHEHFDVLVGENGAVISDEHGDHALAPAVPTELAEALRRRGVRVRQGEVILAGSGSDDQAFFEEIRRLDLDCQLIRNRGELMVLPAGVTKASGLAAGLRRLGVSLHSTIAVGDAENDHVMLERSELGVAVANSVPLLLQSADLVLHRRAGEGVQELVGGPIVSGGRRHVSKRWQIRLGTLDDGADAYLPASQVNLLLTGASQSGKSYLAGLIAEQLVALDYSVLVIDPEGDHARLGDLPGVFVAGGNEELPAPEQLARFAARRLGSVVADLSSLSREESDTYVGHLAPCIERQRLVSGLPHWVVVDEAHGPLGGEASAAQYLAGRAAGYVLVTYLPAELSAEALASLDAVVAVAGGHRSGIPAAAGVLAHFAGRSLQEVVELLDSDEPGRAVLATRERPGDLRRLRLGHRLTDHVRHWHKYATIELPASLRFYFRLSPGQPTGACAANLREFHRELTRCEGLVILHHAGRHDFSRWIHGVFKDDLLAHEIAEVEERATDPAVSSSLLRDEILGAVEARYLE